MDVFRYLDYGALGAAILVLMVAVGVLFRVLMFVREVLDLVLRRIQANTEALTVLASRVGEHVSADEAMHGALGVVRTGGDGRSGRRGS